MSFSASATAASYCLLRIRYYQVLRHVLVLVLRLLRDPRHFVFELLVLELLMGQDQPSPLTFCAYIFAAYTSASLHVRFLKFLLSNSDLQIDLPFPWAHAWYE